jgi:16S rRNA (cytidine1402-2'-O)-methyltransferase
MPGRLVLIATPIGNLGDLSPRAAEELRAADFWIVEDSRVSSRLASHLDIKKSMVVVNDHVTPSKVKSVCQQIAGALSVALLSDGGTPVISDPGALIVDRLRTDHPEVEIDHTPGPSAVTTALCLSGFFGQRYAFLGFLPRKPGPMAQELAPFVDSTLTLVLFESPHRVDALLKVAGEVLGNRRVAICRELTKKFQQIVRTSLLTLRSDEEIPKKGEFTIVIEGHRRIEPVD